MIPVILHHPKGNIKHKNNIIFSKYYIALFLENLCQFMKGHHFRENLPHFASYYAIKV